MYLQGSHTAMKSGMLAAEALYLEMNATTQPEQSLVGELGSSSIKVSI